MDGVAQVEPVSKPWVWAPEALADRDDWIFCLRPETLDEIAAALAGVKARGLAIEAITAADFPLPSLAADVAAIGRRLTDGPGISLVRGVPVGRYDRDNLAIILWGIGAHLGAGVSQSYRGDMIGDVMDMSHTGDVRRSYRSPRPLNLHVDPVDVVGLLCLRRARAGGMSLVTSGLAVHNAILAERPDLLPALYRGYHYRHSEADSTGEPPTTSYRVPVFGMVGDRLICNFNASPISRSLAEDDIENDAAALEAFERFKATAARDDLVYRMMLEPGDLQLLNNRVVLHGRTEFEDYAELGRKRHMLRLWLTMPGWPAMPDETKWHEDGHRGGGFPKLHGATGRPAANRTEQGGTA
jgi:hypothetical protein